MDRFNGASEGVRSSCTDGRGEECRTIQIKSQSNEVSASISMINAFIVRDCGESPDPGDAAHDPGEGGDSGVPRMTQKSLHITNPISIVYKLTDSSIVDTGCSRSLW